MERVLTWHVLERTSPKKTPFVGYCVLCGKPGLTLEDFKKEECPNPRKLSGNEALLEAIEGEEIQ